MRHKAVRYLVYSQICFFAFIAVNFVISPIVNSQDSALSDYGNYRSTILPFSLSIILSSYFLWKTADALPVSKTFMVMKRGLRTLVMLNAIILITPYKAGPLLSAIHMAAAILLFAAEMGIGVWLAFFILRNQAGYYLIAVQLVGLIIAVLSLKEVRVLGIFVVGQLVALGSFAVLLTFSVARLLGVVASEDLQMTPENQSPGTL
jgi:hypothetical protein